MPRFSAAERDRVRERVLAIAEADSRVVAGAVVGSLATGPGDRWSDLDLTFSVEGPIEPVLEEWTSRVVEEFRAVKLFDVRAGPSLYRVFFLPGGLQLDLSFTPAAEFRPRGREFRLLFGTAGEAAPFPPPSAADLFGHGAHHALRARVCVERGRFWQAEYWLSALRGAALALACSRRGLPASHGRGFDDLPADVRAAFRGALAQSLERGELLRALGVAVEGLLREAGDLGAPLEFELRSLAQTADGQSQPNTPAVRSP